MALILCLFSVLKLEGDEWGNNRENFDMFCHFFFLFSLFIEEFSLSVLDLRDLDLFSVVCQVLFLHGNFRYFFCLQYRHLYYYINNFPSVYLVSCSVHDLISISLVLSAIANSEYSHIDGKGAFYPDV